MTPTPSEPVIGQPRVRSRRAAASITLGFGIVLTACGSSPSTTGAVTTERIVKPPADIVQSCSYAPDNKVPPGEPQGIQPPFASFSPDQAATSALQHIADHGGTGLVYGFQLPAGTNLYAGPDTSSGPVGTIPIGRSVILFDPVVWTTSAGQRWLATFMACGGDNPYWVDVHQVAQVDPTVGGGISTQITQLLQSQDYPKTGHASSLPVVVNAARRFAWKDRSVPFSPARAEYLGYGA